MAGVSGRIKGGLSRVPAHTWVAVAILVAFLVLASLYNASVPIYESPDESEHTAFALWLADGQGLPVVDPDDLGPWRQEGSQPPLYYWIIATLLGGIGHDDAESLGSPNPHAVVGEPLRPDNKNIVLHDVEGERWPYRGTVLFIHLARLISTLMGVGTLVAIYYLGRTVFPDRAGIALGMMALVAFMPQFLFLSASVNNDNLVILIASWVVAILALWLSSTKLPSWWQLGIVGVLLGLGALTKSGGLLLWPLAGGTLLWLAWREQALSRRELRWLLLAALAVFATALVVCGWWYVRNYLLYSEPTGIGAHLSVVGQRRRLPRRLPAIWAEFKGFRYSFWLLFGWFNILAPEPFYWVVDALTILGIVGFGVFLARSLRHRPRWTASVIVLLAAWIGLVFAGLLRWTTLTPASQGRLLYPALISVAFFLIVGWAELVPQRLRRGTGAVALVSWGAVAVLALFFVLNPAYALPERAKSSDALSVTPSALDVRYGDCCALLGYTWAEKGPQPGIVLDRPVHAGEWVPLTLVWQSEGEVEQNYSLSVTAVAAGGQVVGQMDTYHGNGMYPTGQWRPAEIIADTVYVPISWKAEGPDLLRFNVRLYDLATLERLPAYAADGSEIETVVAGEAALAPAEWPRPEVNPSIETVFGQEIRLVGANVPPAKVRAGDSVTVTLGWEALDRVTEDYTGFVHLVDGSGSNVAQDDHLPLNGRHPTRVWFEGTVVSDAYHLELPANLGEGTYELWGGLYRADSGVRLEAIAQQDMGADGPRQGERWQDDLVHLGTLVVVPGGP